MRQMAIEYMFIFKVIKAGNLHSAILTFIYRSVSHDVIDFTLNRESLYYMLECLLTILVDVVIGKLLFQM